MIAGHPGRARAHSTQSTGTATVPVAHSAKYGLVAADSESDWDSESDSDASAVYTAVF